MSIRDTASVINDISQEATVAIKHNNSVRKPVFLCIFNMEGCVQCSQKVTHFFFVLALYYSTLDFKLNNDCKIKMLMFNFNIRVFTPT